MKVQINDFEITIPTTLQEFTLGQRIAFQVQHGNELDEWAKRIAAMEESIDKEFEIVTFSYEKMLRTFSFFANVPVEDLKKSAFLDEVATIYYSAVAVLFEEEENIQPQQSFTWNGEQWELHPPELKQGSRMTFGELIDAKQTIQNMQELSKSNYEALLYLCAIYFRKKDEPYEESFLYDGSERLKLMESLPMEYALQVGFFLVFSLNTFIPTSLFSRKPG